MEEHARQRRRSSRVGSPECVTTRSTPTPSPEVVGRIVTATVALVCVVIVYDGWATLKPFDMALVIVGPVVAICTTHIFSASLVQLARQPHG